MHLGLQLEWLRAVSCTVVLCRYELDGRDPNGYVGCLWAVCGIHDQVSPMQCGSSVGSSHWLC